MKKLFLNKPILLEFIANAPAVPVDGAKVIQTKRLTLPHIQKLYDEKICGIHIPQFCDPRLAKLVAKKIIDEIPLNRRNIKGLTRKGHHLDVNYPIGFPKILGMTSKTSEARYFKEAQLTNQRIRDLFEGQLSPLDRLRLELDELWPTGCRVTKTDGKTNLAGAIRRMTPDTLIEGLPEGYCHIDDPNRFDKRRYFSACIYLAVPKSGGALNIWNVAYGAQSSANPIIKLCNQKDPEIQRAIQQRLPPPISVQPAPGDLIIFDVGRPHAVTGFSAGNRICLQTFIRRDIIDQSMSLNS